MKANVFIHMVTEILDIEGKENYEQHVEGTLQSKGDYVYLQYEESMKEAGRVHNLFKIGKNELIVVRKGTISMRQKFIIEEKTTGVYDTPYGRMPFNMETSSYHFSWDAASNVGKLSMKYKMTLEGSETRNYDVVLNLREAGTNE